MAKKVKEEYVFDEASVKYAELSDEKALEQVQKVKDRIAELKTSAEISEDPATENPNARFPRLSYGGNANNNRNSTFWLNDGSYIRLKNIQLSYQYKASFMEKIGLENATFSLIGENLHVWDKLKEKIFDPAQANGNGARYPLQRVYTFQMNLKF